ncbi:MAG: DUF1553 domain-containing protein, partial [Planctomycetes bacterium]|nr:DUF1553 domain-containing protein [Planctomycetota bacterium]
QDFTHEPESNIPLNQYAVLHDTVEILGTSLLGLTMQCARCHDHKFDPISQLDYYKLIAVLTPSYNPAAWKPVFPWKPEIVDRGLPDIPPAQFESWKRDNEEWENLILERQKKIDEIRDHRKSELAKTLSMGTPSDQAKLTQQQITDALTDEEKQAIDNLKTAISEFNSRKHRWDTIQALYDIGSAPETRLLERGNHLTPGIAVSAGIPSVLANGESDQFTSSTGADVESTGLRATLANWLTKPETPASALLARVMTNRIWQHLFGQGLVTTPENFGISGQKPSHPELLEWISSDFSQGNWEIKRLIRKIMSSAAYRQSSEFGRSQLTTSEHPDPSNVLLWRIPLRQLDAEVIRDSVLVVSGELLDELGGPPIRLFSRPDGLVVIDEKHLKRTVDRNRRSIYLVFRRAYNLSLLTAFDQPQIATTCTLR